MNHEPALVLGLLVSLHYGSGWEKWAPLNYGNSTAIDMMLRSFRTSYWRVRFRVLYVLQFADHGILNKLLEEHESLLNDQTVVAIRDYVFSKQVTQYLRQVVETALDDNIRRKALQVLSKISVLWHDKSAGVVLPL